MSFKSRFENPPTSKPADTQLAKPDPLPTGTQRELEEMSRRKMELISTDHRSDQLITDLRSDQNRSAGDTGPAKSDNLGRQNASLANPAGPANAASLASPADLINPVSSATNTSPARLADLNIAKPINRVAVLATLKPTGGYTRLPNWILDSLPAVVDTLEQIVYIHLFRLSHGFGKDQCLVSMDKLAERTGLSRRTVQNAVNGLIKKELIERLAHNFCRGGPQGTIFRVATLAGPAGDAGLAGSSRPADIADLARNAGLASPAPFKEDLKKKVNKKKLNALIAHYALINVGKNYPISELSEDCKTACARDGLEFDPALFNQLISERSRK